MGRELTDTVEPLKPTDIVDPLSGPKGIRTPDLMAASHALYQLSYGPERQSV